MNPQAARQKASGFLLFVGPGPTVIDAGDDRERAIAQAVDLLNVQDNIVFLSKMVANVGGIVVTKDQLILTRKHE
jgi:F420-0:gamma-glutamyl ligase